MPTADRLFSESDRQRINDSVHAAESKTSAEIVPVIATASGRYDRAEDLAGLWLGILLMVLVSIFWPTPATAGDSGNWDPDPPVPEVVALIITMIVGFFVGALAASRTAWLRRLFTPARQMADEVNRSAHSAFFDRRVHHTSRSSGLLLFVSLFEHRTVVLADRQVLEAIGQSAVDELCQMLTQQLRTSGPTEALCQTVSAAGEKLAKVLPRLGDDVNELPDCLVTI